MKTKILVSSIITMAVCLCLIAGSTFALFTSTVKTNIAVTAGNVNVSAAISVPDSDYEGEFDYFTGSSYKETADTRVSYAKDGTPTLTFANGGKATLTEQKLSVNGITPGDSVSFYIDVTNTSNVAVAYNIELSAISGTGDAVNFAKALKFTVAAKNVAQDGSVSYVDIFTSTSGNAKKSQWYSFDNSVINNEGNDAEVIEKAFKITVTFPDDLNVDYSQFESVVAKEITFIVNAVQANGAE